MTAIDFEITTKREKYINTIKELRLKNFNNDLPFLILSEKLPKDRHTRNFGTGILRYRKFLPSAKNTNSKY